MERRKRPAGRKYPHITTDAKEHDHTYCPIVFGVAARAASGKEQWGTLHVWTAPDAEKAKETVSGFYRARNCRQRPAGIPAFSVSARAYPEGRKWKVSLQVFDRKAAKAEIVRRVKNGEPLAYNTRRTQVKE